ncbi:hypothetical protein [Zooshikella harenae]|uniref:RanBP2-type domain-containing protein n=1 Tax=Zooshikella harenae TaxID=2827238 RepID=A0ABS5ZIS2_9GAMM|nr:hypothetical protein [Zooshikella harenae]MBU2713977.1 hypothetical protein [Zooshikella harenae]
MKYQWVCSACQSVNSARDAFCQVCGCPAVADAWLIEGWKESLTQEPKKPSSDLLNVSVWDGWSILKHKTSSCPHCALQMYIYQAKCPHCLNTLSLNERYVLIDNYRQALSYGLRWGGVVFALLIVVVTIVSYFVGNS